MKQSDRDNVVSDHPIHNNNHPEYDNERAELNSVPTVNSEDSDIKQLADLSHMRTTARSAVDSAVGDEQQGNDNHWRKQEQDKNYNKKLEHTEIRKEHKVEHMEVYKEHKVEHMEVYKERKLDRAEVYKERKLERAEIYKERKLERAEIYQERKVERAEIYKARTLEDINLIYSTQTLLSTRHVWTRVKFCSRN